MTEDAQKSSWPAMAAPSGDDSPAPGLYVVALPIGDYQDLSFRAANLLARADLILCESKAKAGHLSRHLDISTPAHTYPRQAPPDKLEAWLRGLWSPDRRLVLIADAGTPGISDPGARIVALARRLEIPVHPVPGPTALTAALSVSGYQANPFLFLGFLPPKAGSRRNILRKYTDFEGLIILYESVHRVEKTLADIFAVWQPTGEVMVARELTKTHEQVVFLRDPAEFAEKVVSKGEFCLIINRSAHERKKWDKTR